VKKSGKRLTSSKVLHFAFVIILCLPFVALSSYRIYSRINFSIKCQRHLKRAADANSVKLALQEMDVVVLYLEQNNMTQGYTKVIYKTPDEDVGFWYENLKAARDELRRVNPEATQLETSNILMKLRETILDESGQRTSVTMPQGIEVFPYNKLFAFAFVITGIICIIAVIYLLRTIKHNESPAEIMSIIGIIGICASLIIIYIWR
jgi:hypothetical protein